MGTRLLCLKWIGQKFHFNANTLDFEIYIFLLSINSLLAIKENTIPFFAFILQITYIEHFFSVFAFGIAYAIFIFEVGYDIHFSFVVFDIHTMIFFLFECGISYII